MKSPFTMDGITLHVCCPRCRERIHDFATGYRLNRCWNHHENVGGGDGTLAFDDESALLLDDSGWQWIITDDGDLIDVHEEDYPEGATA